MPDQPTVCNKAGSEAQWRKKADGKGVPIVSGHFATPRFRVEPGPPRPVPSSRNIFGKERKP